MDNCLSRSSRSYRVADCCEACQNCEETYSEKDDGDGFKSECLLDRAFTVAWYTCSHFERIDNNV